MLFVLGFPIGAFVVWVTWFIKRRDRRSRRPFDEMPKPPGWSLQEKMSDLMMDFTFRLMLGVLIGMVAWALAFSMKSYAGVLLGIGLTGSSIGLLLAGRSLLNVANHRLGFLGEQVVGQILEGLSSPDLKVFHDLEVRQPGKKPWNIDHVVVARGGIFAIETKARRKPRTADGQGHKVVFDGSILRFPEPMKPDGHGIDQARRNAVWLAEKLTNLNGERIEVNPVLVFPGWWIERKGKGSVRVVNAKELGSVINDRKCGLTERQFLAISRQLEERCRIDLSAPA